MTILHPLSDEAAALVAERFRLLAEPMRIRILAHLQDGPLTVRALRERLGATQQNVSKHLSLLHAGGLVDRSKRGTCVEYRIADASVFDMCEQVCGSIDRRLHRDLAVLEGAGVSR